MCADISHVLVKSSSANSGSNITNNFIQFYSPFESSLGKLPLAKIKTDKSTNKKDKNVYLYLMVKHFGLLVTGLFFGVLPF